MKESSFKERTSYYLFFVGQNMAYFIVSVYAMLYFTEKLGIPPYVVGILLLIARVWDAVNDPMFGAIVDKVKFKSGKFKPWINIASVILPLSTILVFAVPDLPLAGKIVFVSIAYLLWDVSYTISDIPGFGIATVMTSNVNERNTMLSFSRIFAIAGLLGVSMLLMPLVNSVGWTFAAVIIGVLAFILMNLQRFFVKERHAAHNEDITVKKIFSSLISNKYLFIYYSAITLMFALSTSMTASSYFAINNLGSDAYVGLLMLVMTLPIFLAGIAAPILIRKFGKNKLSIFAAAASIVLYVGYYFIGYGNIAVVLTASALGGLLAGFINVTYPMFTADCIEYGVWKTGERTAGISFSMQTFTTKLGQAVAAGLGGFLLSAFGYVPNAAQNETALKGIFSMMTLIPAIGMVLFLIIFCMFYKLNESDIQKFMKENEEKGR